MGEVAYGIGSLRLICRGDALSPLYLDPLTHAELVRAVIGFYERQVGKRLSDIDWEELRNLVGEKRLFRALRKVMTHFYRPEDAQVNLDLRRLRLKVANLVNELFGGFVPSELRDEALKLIEDKVGIRGLPGALWLDDPAERVLIKVKEPSIEDVVATFNLETIEALCSLSLSLTIELDREEAMKGVIREALGLLRDLGLAHLAKISGDRLVVHVEGPRGLFSKRSRKTIAYSSRLALALAKLAPYLYVIPSEWRVTSKLALPSGNPRVLLLSRNLKPVLRAMNTKPAGAAPRIAAVTETLYLALKLLGHNPFKGGEPLVLGDTLFLPDLAVRTSLGTYYVRILADLNITYEECVRCELRQLAALSRKLKGRLIVVVDSKAKNYVNECLSLLNNVIFYYADEKGLNIDLEALVKVLSPPFNSAPRLATQKPSSLQHEIM